MVWKSIVTFYYSEKDVKRRFNLSCVTKVSAQTFVRGYKKRIQLGKTLYRFPDFINRKYFTLILKIMPLINCTGKFCYWCNAKLGLPRFKTPPVFIHR